MSKSQGLKGPIFGEVISKRETDRLCRTDASTVTEWTNANINAYIEANSFQYYVAINTWLLLCKDITGNDRLTIELCDYIMKYGLLATIKDCDDLASEVIRNVHENNLFVISSHRNVPINSYLGTIFSGINDESCILQLLRFLKRFTVLKATSLQSSSINKFIETNRRIASIPECTYVEDRIRYYLHEMLKNFSTYYSSNENTLKFSSGVCQGARTVVEKLREFSKYEKYWQGVQLYPIGDIFNNSMWPTPEDDKYPLWDNFYCIQLRSVPKSYKSYRIIAPERSYEAAHLQRIRYAVEKSFMSSKYHDLFNIADQDTNRNIARMSSINGLYATLDLSSASDSISVDLASRLLPKSVLSEIMKYRANYFCVKEGRNEAICSANVFLTSGNPCTFPIEGMIFLAIYLTANDIYTLHTGDKVLTPYVFGDDGICDVSVYPLACDILERLGFIVNESKSYSNGFFRESCGVEYCMGYPMHSDYWPRKPVVCSTPEGIGELCALQHRVFNYFYSEKFLSRVVLALVPDMTSSYPGEECFDLWSRVPNFGIRRAPIAKKPGPLGKTVSPDIPQECFLREAHYALTEKKSAYPDYTSQAFHNLEMFRYAYFLEHGPYYADPLDELLKVSTRHVVHCSSQKPVLELRKIVR